jgi:quinol monooxygenase YgiN
MLIAAGKLMLCPEGVPILREIIGRHREQTMAEPGCVQFSLGVADEARGEVTVLEIWRDEAALLSHHEQRHTAYFIERLGDYITGMDISLYEVASSRPLPPLATLADVPTG